MSNSSIAAFRTDQGSKTLDLLAAMHPQWRIAVNQPRFDGEANAHIIHSSNAAAVWIRHPYAEASAAYRLLAKKWRCWWVEVFFQEHISWEYILYQNEELQQQFIPLPELWKMPDAKLGDSLQLAEVWGVKPQRVARYLRQWDARLKPTKAYFWSDKAKYKQPEQGFDFIYALTGLRFPS